MAVSQTAPFVVDGSFRTSLASRAGVVVRCKALAFSVGLFVVSLGIGWLLLSCLRWRKGRTAGYEMTRLQIRRMDGTRARFGRTLVRELCFLVLVVPTVVVCIVFGVVFVMGASPPDDLLSKPRGAPWDWLTRTQVTQESLGQQGYMELPLPWQGFAHRN